MCDSLARLLELRLRFRRNPEARAYVDRALAVLAQAIGDDADSEAIDCEVTRLADDLAARFGPRVKAPVH
jgi:hypothetical protein